MLNFRHKRQAAKTLAVMVKKNAVKFNKKKIINLNLTSMTKKLIFALLCFLLLMIACRNEENQINYVNQKREIISKSLWKENVGFINAVFNHFEDNFFNGDLKKENFIDLYGNLNWDYSLTFGKNQSNFVVVPSFKYGQVFGALKAEMKGTKVKYSFTKDKNVLDLFDKMVFTKRERIKPLEDKYTTNPTARYDYVCTIKRMSTWVDEGYGNTWIDRYYESCDWVWTTDFPPIDTELHLDDWGQSGGGGGGGGGGGTDQTNSDPCANAKAENTESKSLLDKTNVKSQKEKMVETIKTDKNEKAFSFGKDKDGNYKTTDIKIGTNENSVGISATNVDITIEGGAHTHTPSLYNCFSAGDFYAFHGANSANSSFKYFFVFSEDAGYVMTITNLEKFKKFIQNYPMDDYFDETTGDWKEGSSIHRDFYNAKDQFKNKGMDEDLAFEYAIAMVMSKYDMGISLSKQDDSGNFGSVFVKENQIPIQIMPGIIVSISTFEKTNDCNLQ